MKRFLLIPLLAGALALSACGPIQKAGDFVAAATQEFANPVTANELYKAKVAFAGSQELVKKYQRDCFGSFTPPYPVSYAMIKADPVLSVQCAHRVSRYNAMKRAEDRAFRAIRAADTFITRNPSGNAATYIAAAVKAVGDYQATAGG